MRQKSTEDYGPREYHQNPKRNDSKTTKHGTGSDMHVDQVGRGCQDFAEVTGKVLRTTNRSQKSWAEIAGFGKLSIVGPTLRERGANITNGD